MKKIEELWQERVQAYIKELRRYLKYMFNDHLLFVLVFGGGAAVYYYSQWVKTLTPEFPVGLIMAIILAIFLTISPVYTLLKEADIVFLLPLETKLGTYFNKAIFLSFITQAYINLMVLAAFMPMYVQVTGKGFNTFFYLLAIVLILKYWNLMLHWMMEKFNEGYMAVFDWVIRYLFNGLLLYFIFVDSSIWLIGIVILIIAAFTLYLKSLSGEKTLQWEKLIDKEQSRMQMFYRAANMFTDVPHLRGQVKRRKWLDGLFSNIPYGSNQVYRFLFARTLIRTSEYSGLILRLTLISVIIMQINANLYFSLAIALLFLYLTGFQLIPMIRRYDLKIWTELYPIAKSQKSSAFLDLLLKLLVGQAVVFGVSAGLGSDFLQGVIVGGIAVIFAIVFAKMYAPGRIRKMDGV